MPLFHTRSWCVEWAVAAPTDPRGPSRHRITSLNHQAGRAMLPPGRGWGRPNPTPLRLLASDCAERNLWFSLRTHSLRLQIKSLNIGEDVHAAAASAAASAGTTSIWPRLNAGIGKTVTTAPLRRGGWSAQAMAGSAASYVPSFSQWHDAYFCSCILRRLHRQGMCSDRDLCARLLNKILSPSRRRSIGRLPFYLWYWFNIIALLNVYKYTTGLLQLIHKILPFWFYYWRSPFMKIWLVKGLDYPRWFWLIGRATCYWCSWMVVQNLSFLLEIETKTTQFAPPFSCTSSTLLAL